MCQRCIIHCAAESESSIIRLFGFFLMGAAVVMKTLGLVNFARLNLPVQHKLWKCEVSFSALLLCLLIAHPVCSYCGNYI